MTTRRQFLAAGAAAGSSLLSPHLFAQRRAEQPIPGERPPRCEGVTVENPALRVPVGLIIDDSTCLVNLAHFAIPQFAEVFPKNYKQDWRRLPREIPDAFVRKFADWCRAHGVKGKYSIVPYPACVGWVDREMPGWSRADLLQSVKVAQSLADSWDFHPEMVTHTRIIDLKTGRPFPEASERFMENWGWTDGKSADEIGAYMAYALGMLKNAGFPCEGITTPGGFGNRALASLSLGNLQACRDVFRAEIPHYFRHLFIDDRSVAPRVEYARGIAGPDPECSVSIIGCTGDWFGGWDGLERPALERLITADGKGGRLPQVIARGEPAIIVCHWPGLYCNGDELGFAIFQKVVERLKDHYPDLVWMKLSEVARYWAAKELTRIDRTPAGLRLHAPFSAPNFTLAFSGAPAKISGGGKETSPQEVASANKLRAGTFWRSGARSTLCFDLPKGETTIEFAG